MKIKPHFSRKILRHEPLEDRHLLAVDMTGGMSSAMFPQEELVAPQVAPSFVQEIDSALIPGDIAEQETIFTAQEGAENIIASDATPFEQTSFDCIATMPSVTADVSATSDVAVAVFPQREEFRAFHTLQRVAPGIDENVLASLRRFNERKSHQAEHEHDADAACCAVLENLPQAREHGKISQLEFINAPVAVDDDVMFVPSTSGMDDNSGGGTGSGGNTWTSIGNDDSGGAFSINQFHWARNDTSGPAAGGLHGGDGGIFVDKNTPGQTGDAYKQFKLVVNVTNDTLENMEIGISALDIYNWSTAPAGKVPGAIILDTGAGDNYGSVSFSETTFTVPTKSYGVKEITVTVDGVAHAGDNWKFRATYADGSGEADTRGLHRLEKVVGGM